MPKLIDNWQGAWRFFVIQVQAVGIAAMGSWLVMSEPQKQAILNFLGLPPDTTVALTAMVIFAAGILARVKPQSNL